MLFVSLLIAVLIKQLWGTKNPLHHDQWLSTYHQWLNNKLTRVKSIHATQEPHAQNANDFDGYIISLLCIAVATVLIEIVLKSNSPLIYVIFCSAALLYSFGRNPFSSVISDFIVAEAKNDWHAACVCAETFNISTKEINNGHWSELNTRFLSQASYLGFERFFAVVFWFALLGPLGALLYRLTQLWQLQWPSHNLQRWLWIIEWPAVRALGLSYAVTGNFASCIQSWKICVACISRSSQQVLLENVLATLSVDENLPQNQEVTRRELDALQNLLTRTLWFWLGCIGLLFIIV